MTPAEAFSHFARSFALGLPVGVAYSFLRPLRPRHRILSDLLFLPVLFYAWLVIGFGICRGDLRLGCCSGLVLGIAAWELTLGRLLRPVFTWFFSMLAGFFRF